MKKRTYKRMQNRLYREIKKRMQLEHSIAFPPKVCVEQRKIDTLKTRQRINIERFPVNDPAFDKMCKRDMVYMLCDKLLDDGYVQFYKGENSYAPIEGFAEVECRIDVVRPQKWM